MFNEYIDVLAKCCKSAFQNMTNSSVKSVKVNEVKNLSETFSIVHVIPYEDFDKKIKGDFMLGFVDEPTAIFVASAIAGKMGVSPVEKFDEMSSDIIGEFVNTVVGNAISVWDKMHFRVKFNHPELLRDKHLNADDLPSTEIYKIILKLCVEDNKKDLECENVIFMVTFSKIAEKELSGRRILVVDDSALVRQVITKHLEEQGAEVDQAKDGVEAVEKHKSFNPDLTIMDLIMPKMGGLDTIVKIRESTPEAKFIILTSSARKDEVITAGTLNVLDYVLKPMDIEDFLSKVKKALE